MKLMKMSLILYNIKLKNQKIKKTIMKYKVFFYATTGKDGIIATPQIPSSFELSER